MLINTQVPICVLLSEQCSIEVLTLLKKHKFKIDLKLYFYLFVVFDVILF